MTYFWAKTTYEGKPGISVYDHMVNVGSVAQCLAEMSPNLLRRFHIESSMVGALAALHDLGKISPGFQRKCEVCSREDYDKSLATGAGLPQRSQPWQRSHLQYKHFSSRPANHDTAKFIAPSSRTSWAPKSTNIGDIAERSNPARLAAPIDWIVNVETLHQ